MYRFANEHARVGEAKTRGRGKWRDLVPAPAHEWRGRAKWKASGTGATPETIEHTHGPVRW